MTTREALRPASSISCRRTRRSLRMHGSWTSAMPPMRTGRRLARRRSPLWIVVSQILRQVV